MSWSQVVGQALRLNSEPANTRHTGNQVVSYVPYNIAPTVSAFLRRHVTKALQTNPFFRREFVSLALSGVVLICSFDMCCAVKVMT